jgi:hypothetical protein
MYSLIRSGVEDPRLSEAIFYEVTIGNPYAVAAMSKKTPLSPEVGRVDHPHSQPNR